MKPRALVVTTAHWPDDTRIRERLIRSLAQDFSVDYAARSPGPSDTSDLRYIELRGFRLRRNLEAVRIALGRRWDVLIIHDPELIAMGLLARLLRRRPVVFDVHEDYPAAARIREWVPDPMRSLISRLARVVMKTVEWPLTITLAESGYRKMFVNEHPVFPNYPSTQTYPQVVANRREEAVYLGDVTVARGLDLAAEACSIAGIPLRLIGSVSTGMEKALSGSGVDARLEGVLPNREALVIVSGCAVGLVPLRDVPNYRDSQPTKLLEYLALGVPIVASDLPGTRDLVEGLDAVLLVPPGDVRAMAEAISEACSHSMRRAAVSQAEEIRERFRWPEEEVRAFYDDLVNR